MLTCPKCGAFYAIGSSAFCLTDGMPLVNVAPGSEGWTKGKRQFEEQTKALKKQQRKSKWRRVLLSGITTLVVMSVVTVVTINGLMLLKLTPDEAAPVVPNTPVVVAPIPEPPLAPGSTAPNPTTDETPTRNSPVEPSRPTKNTSTKDSPGGPTGPRKSGTTKDNPIGPSGPGKGGTTKDIPATGNDPIKDPRDKGPRRKAGSPAKDPVPQTHVYPKRNRCSYVL